MRNPATLLSKKEILNKEPTRALRSRITEEPFCPAGQQDDSTNRKLEFLDIQITMYNFFTSTSAYRFIV